MALGTFARGGVGVRGSAGQPVDTAITLLYRAFAKEQSGHAEFRIGVLAESFQAIGNPGHDVARDAICHPPPPQRGHEPTRVYRDHAGTAVCHHQSEPWICRGAVCVLAPDRGIHPHHDIFCIGDLSATSSRARFVTELMPSPLTGELNVQRRPKLVKISIKPSPVKPMKKSNVQVGMLSPRKVQSTCE